MTNFVHEVHHKQIFKQLKTDDPGKLQKKKRKISNMGKPSWINKLHYAQSQK